MLSVFCYHPLLEKYVTDTYRWIMSVKDAMQSRNQRNGRQQDRTEQLCADLEPEDRGTVGVKACEGAGGGLGGSAEQVEGTEVVEAATEDELEAKRG